VIIDDHPDIFPVNFRVDHGAVVFRTGEGAKLAALKDREQVVFEVDGFTENGAVMWSVVVKGKRELLQKTEDLLDAVSLHVFPWEAGSKDHFVRILPNSVTGRRFTIAEPMSWSESEPSARPASDE